ncbi:hypothetical protein FVB32_15085 [Flagellimonas hymeniacidonis]|uniref:Uncharacterized protein n=1 Tax=Flagellimonas hymeniacidonis TaxID=2603628 RepID=A0A5C8V495_9FLAO|nr:hypothetical protein [Flagellimonas hymeniacidonis]TXN35889.1 hypothetical protein FVB32_15085 [Flagellimonas hymeniacidonis]
MKKNFTFIASILMIFSGFAKERMIKGKVTNGETPMANVRIQVVNQGITSSSNTDGNYNIVASTGDMLFYNADGMEPLQIRVEDVTKTLNVVMFPRVEKLENVTVTRNKRNGQKELEMDYPYNPNIIKTAFGFLDKTRTSYSVRMLMAEEFLPGEYNLANVLRGRFAGVRVSSGRGFGLGNAAGSARAVFFRSNWPAVFDIDGQVFTDFPDFIDVQNIDRIAVIPSAIGTVRYGNLAKGGVVVINTKTGTMIPKDKNGLYLDRMRLRNNKYDGTALTPEKVMKNAPTYLQELKDSNSFENAKESFETHSKKYTSSPYFLLDSYQYFYEKWNQEKYADDIIEKGYGLIKNNAVLLKALAYIYESQGRYDMAHGAFREAFILRPQYRQSYLDLANSNRNLSNAKRAAVLYARYFHLVDEGLMQMDSSNFSKIINREFNNLVALEKTGMTSIEKDGEDFNNTRLKLEWNDSEAEFELQFVNPDNQYYTWKHSLKENADTIGKEKDFGFSCAEYLIDDSFSGHWRVNVKYLGNKSLTPTYLKAVVYHNYGSKSQRKEVKVFKLGTKNVNQALFHINKAASTPLN